MENKKLEQDLDYLRFDLTDIISSEMYCDSELRQKPEDVAEEILNRVKEVIEQYDE